MFVAKYPDWLAAVRLRDGSHLFFDGAKDLFKYLHDPKKYDPGRKPEDLQAIMVRDYYDLSWIDARTSTAPWGGNSFPWRRKPMRGSS
jgi:copper chaperone NosL